MKLLVCATEYYPYGSGIANVAYEVVEQLKKSGVDCVVCSPTGPDIQLGSSKLIEKSGIIGLLYYWHRVSKYFKKNEYDVVWLHNPLFIEISPFKNSLVTMNSTSYGQVIHKIYSLPLHIYKKVTSIIEKYCLNKMNGAKFIGVGSNICEELEEIGINRQKITHIPNGVNTERFRPSDNKKMLRKKFKLPKDDLIILSFGRLTEVKQPQKLIEVFSGIERELKHVTIVIAGSGKLLDKTKEFVRQKRLRNVKFLGYVDHEKDAHDLYACPDYFIITSKYEGGEPTLTLAEAMASSLPCIVSDIPNFRFIERIKSGIVVDFDDVGKAAKEITEYLGKDNSGHAKNAREYAVNNLDWEIIAERYLVLFNEIKIKGT